MNGQNQSKRLGFISDIYSRILYQDVLFSFQNVDNLKLNPAGKIFFLKNLYQLLGIYFTNNCINLIQNSPSQNKKLSFLSHFFPIPLYLLFSR